MPDFRPPFDILIVDRSPIFRLGLKSFLEDLDLVNNVFEASNCNEGIEMFQYHRYHLVLIGMESTESERYDQIYLECRRLSHCRVITMVRREDEHQIMIALKGGSHALLNKAGEMDQIGMAIQQCAQDQVYYSKDIAGVVLSKIVRTNPEIKSLLRKPQFTKREMDVIHLICQQKSAKEIGAELFINEKTVDFHRQKIISKMGVRNIIGLVLFAVKFELIDLSEIKFH